VNHKLRATMADVGYSDAHATLVEWGSSIRAQWVVDNAHLTVQAPR
jgi:hypothetical protein